MKFCNNCWCSSIGFKVSFVEDNGNRVDYDNVFNTLEELDEFAERQIELIEEYVGYVPIEVCTNCLQNCISQGSDDHE